MTATRDDRVGPPSAGLARSVGTATPAVRVLLAAGVFVIAALLGAGGVLLARMGGFALAVAIFIAFPAAEIGLLAAAFIAAPRSQYGTALDALAARMGERRVARRIAAALMLGGALLSMFAALAPRWI